MVAQQVLHPPGKVDLPPAHKPPPEEVPAVVSPVDVQVKGQGLRAERGRERQHRKVRPRRADLLPEHKVVVDRANRCAGQRGRAPLHRQVQKGHPLRPAKAHLLRAGAQEMRRRGRARKIGQVVRIQVRDAVVPQANPALHRLRPAKCRKIGELRRKKALHIVPSVLPRVRGGQREIV